MAKAKTTGKAKSSPKAKTTAKPKTAAKSGAKPSAREKAFLEIRKMLVDQRTSLIREAEATLNELPGELNFPDMGDQATAESDRNFMLRLRSRERKLIQKIDETIERLDSGNYGVCEDCGEDINLKRLEARPVTTFCIECKTRQEEDEKLRES